jgi:plasmid maintenance system antidote protein VapI
MVQNDPDLHVIENQTVLSSDDEERLPKRFSIEAIEKELGLPPVEGALLPKLLSIASIEKELGLPPVEGALLPKLLSIASIEKELGLPPVEMKPFVFRPLSIEAIEKEIESEAQIIENQAIKRQAIGTKVQKMESQRIAPLNERQDMIRAALKHTLLNSGKTTNEISRKGTISKTEVSSFKNGTRNISLDRCLELTCKLGLTTYFLNHLQRGINNRLTEINGTTFKTTKTQLNLF